MARKLLLVAVWLAFAVLAFSAGLLAPAGWHSEAQQLASQAELALGRLAGMAAPAASAPSAAASASSAAIAPTAASPTSSANTIAREQLLSPVPALPGRRVGLLAGQFPVEAAAQSLATAAAQHGLAATVVTVREANGQISWLVLLGSFENEADALVKAPGWAAQLSLSAPLPVLLLPPPAPKP